MSPIFAWTAPGANYPEFLNIDDGPEDKHGQATIIVTVRGPAADGAPGPTVSVTLSLGDYAQLVGFLKTDFDRNLQLRI